MQETLLLATEWCEARGPGPLIGLFNNLELVCLAIKNYLNAPILFHEGIPVTIDEINFIMQQVPEEGANKILILEDENGLQAAVFEMTLNKQIYFPA
jgi:hypothetical protein